MEMIGQEQRVKAKFRIFGPTCRSKSASHHHQRVQQGRTCRGAMTGYNSLVGNRELDDGTKSNVDTIRLKSFTVISESEHHTHASIIIR